MLSGAKWRWLSNEAYCHLWQQPFSAIVNGWNEARRCPSRSCCDSLGVLPHGTCGTSTNQQGCWTGKHKTMNCPHTSIVQRSLAADDEIMFASHMPIIIYSDATTTNNSAMICHFQKLETCSLDKIYSGHLCNSIRLPQSRIGARFSKTTITVCTASQASLPKV